MIVNDKKNKKKIMIAVAAAAVPLAVFLVYMAMPATVIYKSAQIGNPSLDFQVQTAEKIFEGTVSKVEYKQIDTARTDTPLGSSQPETTGYQELFQVVTVDVDKYLADTTGGQPSQVQFIDVANGCLDALQKNCQVHELAIEYKVGEKGLFIVDRISDPANGPLDGLLSGGGYLRMYKITNGDKAESALEEHQGKVPRNLTDLEQAINNILAKKA